MLIEQHPLWDHVQVSFVITNKDIVVYQGLRFQIIIHILLLTFVLQYSLHNSFRFRVIALNDAGRSVASEPSEPVVVDVPGVRIAPYFVSSLTDVVALEHEQVMTK